MSSGARQDTDPEGGQNPTVGFWSFRCHCSLNIGNLRLRLPQTLWIMYVIVVPCGMQVEYNCSQTMDTLDLNMDDEILDMLQVGGDRKGKGKGKLVGYYFSI